MRGSGPAYFVSSRQSPISSSLTKCAQKKELTAEEKDYKSRCKLEREKLIKFATRIPAFMYLTDFRKRLNI